MSDYTVANFMDLEGSSNPDRDTRFARSHIGSEHVGVSYFKYGPNVHQSRGHSHREQEEVYVVISGSGHAKLNDEVVQLKQWDVLRVAPSTVRAFASGPQGMELVIAANDRPEGGDGAVVEDFWPDES
jgi:mannose-6-phosphate isomerase-like protein (cupin superfamily)